MNGSFKDLSACAHCGLCPIQGPPPYPTADPCLGILPDVTQACCGHGGKVHNAEAYGGTVDEVVAHTAYVVISPGDAPGTFHPDAVGPWHVLRGEDALRYFDARGVGPRRALERRAEAAA